MLAVDDLVSMAKLWYWVFPSALLVVPVTFQPQQQLGHSGVPVLVLVQSFQYAAFLQC
jgi:hypothetical protein